jgi:hypothetical protein
MLIIYANQQIIGRFFFAVSYFFISCEKLAID